MDLIGGYHVATRENHYEAPQPAPLSPADANQLYAMLPWNRKSAYVSRITALSLCCGPAILVVSTTNRGIG